MVTTCLSLVFGYLVVVPAFLFSAAKYWLNIQTLGAMQLVCLVGYSLFLYIPCTVLATFSVFSWPILAVAVASSTLFILRSLKPVVGPNEKAVPVIAIFVAAQVLFMLVIKFQFYSHKNTIKKSMLSA